MALQPMYPGINNSVPTSLAVALAANEEIITLVNGEHLPQGPNLATLGEDDGAELIYYNAKNGNSLLGVLRGFHGTVAQAWPVGSLVYRAYSTVDQDAFIGNIGALDARTAGLKGGAFADIGTGAEDVAAGDHAHSQYLEVETDPTVPVWAKAIAKPTYTAAEIGAVASLSGKGDPTALSAAMVTITANRALLPSDAGKVLYVSAAEAVTVTIPSDTAAAFPIGTEIEVAQEGVGAVLFSAEEGVALHSPGDARQIAEQYACAVLRKVGANDWRLAGGLA